MSRPFPVTPSGRHQATAFPCPSSSTSSSLADAWSTYQAAHSRSADANGER